MRNITSVKDATGAAVRTHICNELADKAATFQPLWDHKRHDGSDCVNWKDYVAKMRERTSQGGEVELLAACEIYNLKIILVRPGNETIQLGSGK